ncbi:RagB/SusD family nutrient uptake outer membrane protein [Chitinophaga sp. Ak27]|uniref:RagB/SusD family nutrient uptake outer membrane protein n=1 Tax=Chitinophaga sp. Ak27 TaxID=2726116 RepID=UPI00145DDDD1|nr:RagB/SusD family nutrient uptake outer membrane protein [Chitinophaga sp. Ak27]NLU95686.1 RagB/SusD family nutrient uptake outer membrane protein [Chitinophaga sp. Ak27]
MKRMKTKNILLVPFLVISVMLQPSCSKSFLEIEPKGAVIAKTTADYEELLNAISLGGSYAAGIYMGDEMAAQESYINTAALRTQRLFRYEDRVYDEDELPTETWYLSSVYVFNKVISEVMASANGSDQKKKTLLAEARVGRALCHFYFLNDYSKPYNAATASTDLGVPLLTAADVTRTQFVRATVQETYDFIIKDLTEALPDLGPLKHRRKFSRAAAEFLLGRVYLFMARFEDARTHIDAAFGEIAKSQIPLALYDYNVVLDPDASATWLPDLGYGLSNYPLAAVNQEVIYNVSMGNFQLQEANTFVFSPQTAALYKPSDKRLYMFTGYELFNPDGVFPRGMRRYSANLFFGIDIGPALPDLYLMRAELKARAGDLAGAVQDLEALRKKRMPAEAASVPSDVAGNKEALVRFILEERIREFATSGSRWMDMRRLSVDPVYNTTVKYTHELYDAQGNVVATYKLRPERFALKFGERMLAQNKGLVENP